MGRLVGLELHNFKSYRGTASIGFGTANFTSIIGPNGSGKSNMMDAISFVLGVRSSHLRSNQLKDLIYRGRIDAEEESADEEDENSTTAYVMAIYEKSDGTLLQLKRTINRNGTSDYRINNKSISAAEYTNVLKGENILIKARNFLVFQGDVEQIASQSAVDLSKLLETVSGSIEYKRDYERLKDEQDVAKNETAAILSKRRTLMSEVKQYKEQRHEADLFKAKVKEKHELIKLSTLWKLYHAELKRSSASKRFDSIKAKVKKLKQQIIKEEASFKASKVEHAKELLRLSKYENLIDTKKDDIRVKKNALLPIVAQKDVTSKKIVALSKRVKDLTADLERQATYVSDVEKQIKVVSKTKGIAEKEFQSRQTVSKVSLDDQKEYEVLKQKFLIEENGAAEDETLRLLLNKRSEIESMLHNLETQKSASNERVEELKLQQSELKEQLSSASTELNQLIEKLAEKRHKVKELVKKSEDFEKKEHEIATKLRDTLVKLEDLNASQRDTKRETKLRDNVSILKRLFPGVIGLLSDLCHPKQQKYEVAVSTILGKNFDSIVVENSVIAHQCISYLKEQRSGVASFIPLDSIDARPVDHNLRHLHPGVKPAIDVVDYEAYLEKAIQYSCGNSIVCDNIEIAKEVRWRRNIDVKAVTLDGSLIHKAGLMTGGRSTQERRWNKNEVQSLTKLKEDLSFRLQELQNAKPDPFQVKTIENEALDLETEMQTYRRQREELERSILSNDAEIRHYTQDDESLARKKEQDIKLKEINSQIANQEKKISDLQKSIFSSFCRKLGFKSVKEYEVTSGDQLREQTRELKQYNNDLVKLQKKLDFEKERHEETKARIDKISADIQAQEQLLKKLLKNIEIINDAVDTLEAELEVSKDELKDYEKSIESKLSATKKIEDRLHELTTINEELNKSLEILHQDVEKFTLERIAILKNCKIENIELPIVSETTLEALPIESTEETVEISEAIEIDYDVLSTRYKENNNDIIAKEFEEKISDISKELESLSPNIKAIERLNEVEKKLDDIERELAKTRSKELKTVKEFQEVKKQRYEVFINAFNHISERIDPIYKELTKTTTSSTLGGGSAYLTLEDDDEPYLHGIRYHAMPPMKRFKDMEFLSGGEKTIAALALLFSIHSFNPSPFFVLDEVDAALDNSNVNKIANYITKHAGPGFQIIVISLKNGLFEKSEALVGIYREQKENSSKTLTLDLRNYPEVA